MPKKTLPQKSLLVVNSTEWRNLCARGFVRMLDIRVQEDPLEDDARAALFALAPTTKAGSGVDLLVLEVRGDWPKEAVAHPMQPGLHILTLGDVRSHHVVDPDHLAYYRQEGLKAGVEVSDETFEIAWRKWDLSERTADAVGAVQGLLASTSLPPLIEGSRDLQAWSDLVGHALTVEQVSDGSADLGASLVALALEVDDGAAAVRETEAFHLAANIEWIELATGRDPLASRPIELCVRAAISEAKQRPWHSLRRVESATRAALDLLAAAHPHAYSDEVDPRSVGVLVRLVAEAQGGTPEPADVARAIRDLSSVSTEVGRFGAVVLGSVLGPERVRQLVLHLDSRTTGRR